MKIDVLFCGGYDWMGEYLHGFECDLLKLSYFESGKDVPELHLVTGASTDSVSINLDGERLEVSGDEFIELSLKRNFGRYPSIDDVIGLYSENENIVLNSVDDSELDVRIITNCLFKNSLPRTDTELVLIVDNRDKVLDGVVVPIALSELLTSCSDIDCAKEYVVFDKYAELESALSKYGFEVVVK